MVPPAVFPGQKNDPHTAKKYGAPAPGGLRRFLPGRNDDLRQTSVNFVVFDTFNLIFMSFGFLVNNKGLSTGVKYIKAVPVELLIGIGPWLDGR